MANTIEALTREQFTAILRRARAARVVRAYGRLHGFGRSIVLSNGAIVRLDTWIPDFIGALNLHPREVR
jgi:hypothetical protein